MHALHAVARPLQPGWGRIGLLAGALACGLVVWAWPAGLSAARTAGIVTGWLGVALLLASLLLMLREPWLARVFGGLAPMYQGHHVLGVLAYVALLVHPLALALDAGAESPARAWAALAPWGNGWPVGLGWAALLGLMAGLAVALSPRLPYASWRRWHHLLSLSVPLGAAHLVALGLGLAPLAAAALAFALLAWRALRTDLGLGAHPYVVRRVVHLSPAAVELSLQPMPGVPAARVAGRPGQFVLAAFPGGPGWRGCGEFHPFTVSRIGGDGQLALGIKALGDCTQHLQSIVPGAQARVQGPFGSFFTEPRGPSLWIAGGIGLTPFLAALRQGRLPHPVHLLYLHREGPHAPYADALQALAARQPRLRLQVVDTGELPPDLDRLLPPATELAGCECQLCGPAPMVEAAVRALRARGVPAHRIHHERFAFR